MKFFKLADSDEFKNAWWDDDKIIMDSIICPLDEGHRGGTPRRNDLTIKLKSNRIGDFVWTWYSECLVTDEVARLFKEARFTGFELRPVTISQVIKRRGVHKPIPKLWELKVIGWGGAAPPESGIKLSSECKACGLLEYTHFDDASKLIDESKWDGSDFLFIWPLPGYIFVVERVKDFILANKLRGSKLIPMEELKGKSHLFDSLGPGRLSYYLPDHLARKYGEPLGIY